MLLCVFKVCSSILSFSSFCKLLQVLSKILYLSCSSQLVTARYERLSSNYQERRAKYILPVMWRCPAIHLAALRLAAKAGISAQYLGSLARGWWALTAQLELRIKSDLQSLARMDLSPAVLKHLVCNSEKGSCLEIAPQIWMICKVQSCSINLSASHSLKSDGYFAAEIQKLKIPCCKAEQLCPERELCRSPVL